MSYRIFQAAAFIALLVAARLGYGAAPQTYSALLADGTRLTGNALTDWQDSPARMKLDGRPIADAKNPLVWLRNTQLTPKPVTGPVVYLFGGDMLPGDVYTYRSGREEERNVDPPHLLVTPSAAVDWPNSVRHRARRRFDSGAERNSIRVALPFVQRVVWQRRGNSRYTPSTAYLRDGRVITYRSLRWGEAGLRLLHSEGTLDAAFDELAELHMPARDAWEVFLDQAALLNPTEPPRFVQYTTVDGVRATGSGWWFQMPMFYMPPHDLRTRTQAPGHWLVAVQPAWSLDLLWLPWDQLVLRHYFDATELPLSALDPVRAVSSGGLASGWPWQRGANVQFGPLLADGRQYGWGFGVHAAQRMEFNLPSCVREFRTGVGLDTAIGSDGCARATVLLVKGGSDSSDEATSREDSSRELFSSEALLGSSDVVETPWLAIPVNHGGERRLALVADPLLQDHPAGAMPLEIGDAVDWLEPRLKLNQEEVLAQIADHVKSHGEDSPWHTEYAVTRRKNIPKMLERTNGMLPFSFDNVRFTHGSELSHPADRPFVYLTPFVGDDPAVIRKVVRMPAEGGAQLKFDVNHHRLGKSRVVVLVGGIRMHDAEVGVGKNRDRWEPAKVDLSFFAGREVAVEIYSMGPHSYHGGLYISGIEWAGF